jgi:hypothetical protein
MYCILLTLCIYDSHFAIPDGFAKSQTSIVLQEYFQNDSVISKQQMPTLKILVPSKVDCRFNNFFRKLMKTKNILKILIILFDSK